MRKALLLWSTMLLASTVSATAQTDSVNVWPRDAAIAQHAIEVESLFPMFFTGGYHFGIGYRHDRLRLRVSVISGGSYDAEPAGIGNSSNDFERRYRPSPGIFLGYNPWRGLETYTYLELHTFEIVQKSSGQTRRIHSTDVGGGVSYQLFLWRGLYLQPGMHVYLRTDHSAAFNGQTYRIPNVDLSPVIRVGYRLWSLP